MGTTPPLHSATGSWAERRRRIGQRTFHGVSFRYVALCDVLGFRALLANRGVDWINEQYRNLMSDVRQASRYEARSQVFSDSILMYSKPLHEPTVRADGTRISVHEDALRHEVDGFLAWVAHVVRAALKHGLPLRGGIAAGPCAISARQQLFVGEPIVDAYLVEQSQDWAGVALHESCFAWTGRPPVDGYFRQVVRYPVPPNARVDRIDVEWSLAWPVTLDGIDEKTQVRVDHLARAHVGTPFEERWRNTSDYISHLRSLQEIQRDLISKLRYGQRGAGDEPRSS